jgi:hypothetical protein
VGERARVSPHHERPRLLRNPRGQRWSLSERRANSNSGLALRRRREDRRKTRSKRIERTLNREALLSIDEGGTRVSMLPLHAAVSGHPPDRIQITPPGRGAGTRSASVRGLRRRGRQDDRAVCCRNRLQQTWSIALITLTTVGVAAQGKTDFSGRWILATPQQSDTHIPLALYRRP